ncbi:glycosyltransferase family 2 protein [Zavarzinella formosa]|uniref:glycosyltransferase family 2 protein n=1 Tax=Zavarzinella formosa TaxID=360055 RepID=UPI00037611E1|nr:glycosyltransferase family 2 protein [Zavarzinella formosa]
MSNSDCVPKLTVVSPAFNESDVLPIFHEQLSRVLDGLQDRFSLKVLYVDDGSSDDTPRVLADLARRDSRVRYLRLSRNFGHQAALSAGLREADGDVVISMDSDGQHPPELIPQLIARWEEGHDVVLTLRTDHESLGWFKKKSSAFFYFFMRYCSGMDIRPAAADFRLLSRPALDAFLSLPERHQFIRGMVHWIGFRTTEIDFKAPQRLAGKSKFTLLKMVRLARDGLLSFSRVPLHAAIVICGLLTLLSAAGCLGAWLVFAPADSVRWLLLAELIGGHVIVAGLLGVLFAISEYIARIHEQILGRPIYIIEHDSDSQKHAATIVRDSLHRRGAA